MDCCDKPYGKIENIFYPCIVATYDAEMPNRRSAINKAGNFAVGQTIGTWVRVPGISDNMVERYQGQVLSLHETGETLDGHIRYIMRVAFPTANFGGSLTQMMTALVGNDVSTSVKAKLIDIEFYNGAETQFSMPQKGINELRKLTGVYDRPIVLNMIKPCAGYTPKEGLEMFCEVARGGMDLVKDDELLGSPEYNDVVERTSLYVKAAEEIYSETGKRTIYVPNVSGRPSQMRDNVRRVIDAGAKACLINFVFGGLDTMLEISEEFGNDIFIIGHYAGVSVMGTGISNGVFLGTLPRLAGAHAVMTMCPNVKDDESMQDFFETVQMQRLTIPQLPTVVTAVGGGITPVNQVWIQKELGNDIIIGIGGAIQGHPFGVVAGAKTAIVAVSSTAKGIPLDEVAENDAGLRKAMEIWPA